MLNAPWIDPRAVDFSDSYNPLSRPRWYQTRNPFLYQVFNGAVWQAIRNAKNMDPRIWSTPSPQDQTIAPGTTFSQSVNIEPNTWLYGFDIYSEQPEGFYLQITDEETGAQIFSQQILSQDLAPSGENGPIVYLEEPRLFLPPSRPVVTIVNNSGDPNSCAVNLFCAVEVFFV